MNVFCIALAFQTIINQTSALVCVAHFVSPLLLLLPLPKSDVNFYVMMFAVFYPSQKP